MCQTDIYYKVYPHLDNAKYLTSILSSDWMLGATVPSNTSHLDSKHSTPAAAARVNKPTPRFDDEEMAEAMAAQRGAEADADTKSSDTMSDVSSSTRIATGSGGRSGGGGGSISSGGNFSHSAAAASNDQLTATDKAEAFLNSRLTPSQPKPSQSQSQSQSRGQSISSTVSTAGSGSGSGSGGGGADPIVPPSQSMCGLSPMIYILDDQLHVWKDLRQFRRVIPMHVAPFQYIPTLRLFSTDSTDGSTKWYSRVASFNLKTLDYFDVSKFLTARFAQKELIGHRIMPNDLIKVIIEYLTATESTPTESERSEPAESYVTLHLCEGVCQSVTVHSIVADIYNKTGDKGSIRCRTCASTHSITQTVSPLSNPVSPNALPDALCLHQTG